MCSALLAFSCTGLVNRFAFYPDSSTRIPEAELPEHVRVVSIPTLDGLTIEGLLFSRGAESRGLIIYFHGNAGNMFHRIPEAVRLSGLGFKVLVVSYRGYAGSEGSPSEQGVYRDADAGLHFAETELKIPLQDIIIYGRSIGSAVAVHTAQNRNIRKLILVTPLSTGKDVVRSTALGFLSFLAGSPFDTMAKINNVQSPILIIHGTEDEVIPYELGERLYRSFSGEKRMVTIEGGHHNDLEMINPKLYWDEVERFLSEGTRGVSE